MTPEERSLLERTHALAEENNEILRGLRRSSRFATAMRVLYWVVIIVLSFGAYYLIQPYLTTMLGLYDQASGGLGGNMNAAQNAADQLRGLLK